MKKLVKTSMAYKLRPFYHAAVPNYLSRLGKQISPQNNLTRLGYRTLTSFEICGYPAGHTAALVSFLLNFEQKCTFSDPAAFFEKFIH